MAEVTDTAAAIARVRSEEGRLPPERRLFVDPWAHLFTGGAEGASVTEAFLSVPFFREQVRLRTRFIDDFIREGLHAGTRELVILGAGFDCRALRLGEITETHTLVYEMDLPEQLETKRRILERAGMTFPERVRFVSCDFRKADWETAAREELEERDFHFGRPALFVLEGVISYLLPGEIERTFRWMATTAGRSSSAVFNYNLASLNPKDVPELMHATGFREVENLRMDEIYTRYLPPPVPSGGELFYVGVART